LNALLSV